MTFSSMLHKKDKHLGIFLCYSFDFSNNDCYSLLTGGHNHFCMCLDSETDVLAENKGH